MIKKIVLASVLVLGLALYFRSGVKLGEIIKLRDGSVQGIVSSSRDGREFYAWYHIPFAKPPVGSLRFADPEPAESWEGVRDGIRYGPHCAQTGVHMTGASGLVGEEDCLHLNVFVPKKIYEESENSEKKFPVLLFIHGGAYMWGSGDMMQAEYVADEDIVFVSIQYRLDILGFLTTGDEVVRGNMGLKDQTMALKWVSKNIQYFGGDPAQVTIMGSSAGGASVHQHMQSPLSKGLFHKAISQSGVATASWGIMPMERALEKTRDIAGKLHCPTSDNQKLIECLRSVSIKDLLEPFKDLSVSTKFTGSLGHPFVRNVYVFKPTSLVDGFAPTIEAVKDEKAFLTEHPMKLMAEGKSHRVPHWIEFCTHEGLITSVYFIADPSRMSAFELNPDKYIQSQFGIRGENKDQLSKQIWDYYFPPSEIAQLSTEAKLSKYTDMFGDAAFALDIHEAARYQRKYSPVYYSIFNNTDGPNMFVELATSIQGKYPIAIEIGMLLGKLLFKAVFRIESPDYGIPHSMDFVYYTPQMGMSMAHKWSSHYEYSQDLVRLLADFMRDDTNMKFRGVPFEATPSEGPLRLFEFKSERAEMRSEPYEDRMIFLRSLGLRTAANKD